MSKKQLISDYTHGSIPKHLVHFMLPFMASNALQVVYSLVDMIVVGRFVGSAGLAGVSQGSMIILFFTMFCMGFSNSGQILISQLVGANRKEELNSVIGTMFSVMTIGGLLLSVLAVVFRSGIANLLKIPGDAREMAITYVLICGGGLLFTCLYNTVSAALRGMGDSRHPFVFITLSSVLNLILDLLFTGFLGWGVTGAAAATIISQAVSFIAAIVFLYQRRTDFCFDFRIPSFRIHRDICVKMFKLGIPLAIQACSVNISLLFCNTFINKIGVAATATFGVGLKVDDIANKVTMGIQYAAGPMVGQNIGAREYGRVRSVVYWTWIFSGILFGVFLVCYLLFGREIFSLFTDDPEVLDLAPVFVSCIIWSFPGITFMRGSSSFLNGTGNATILMILSFVDAGSRVLFCWFLGIVCNLGFVGFVLGFGLACYGSALPGTLYFLFAPWTKRQTMVSAKQQNT